MIKSRTKSHPDNGRCLKCKGATATATSGDDKEDKKTKYPERGTHQKEITRSLTTDGDEKVTAKVTPPEKVDIFERETMRSLAI